jgi:predicted Zn-dependent protease
MNQISKVTTIIILFFILSCSSDKSETEIGDGITPNLNLKPTGSSANDFLAGSNYTSLVVEIIYVEGFKPNDASIQNFKTFLENRLNKPNGITIIEKKIDSPNLAPYSIEDLELVEESFRSFYNNQNILTLYAFFADGGSINDNNNSFVLGTAYKNTSFVIYENTIMNNSGGLGQPNRTNLETVVMQHEMGHLLGLVNLGTPMQTVHNDTTHDKHCNNENCLMYWKTETGDIFNTLLGGEIPTLDTACILDLQANGGK